MIKTDKQLIDEFLELQEHPKQMTDEQLHHALDDEQMHELVEQMAFAKRAFKYEEVQTVCPPIDEEWAKFAASHPDRQQERGKVYKIAASIIGVLFVSGIAFAAIHVVRTRSAAEVQIVQVAQTTAENAPVSCPADTLATEPYVFDNVTLEKILSEIADVHRVSVDFQNEEARQLRFHFVWKREDSLARTVERLNTFEAVNIIVVDNQKLMVK